MTLLLIYEGERDGKFDWTDTVLVSEHAASMGGSQVFLEEGETQTAADMTKSIAIASANDAAVAMAEFLAGSEEAFVQKMNERAKEFGMEDTNFVNACGLDTEGHVSSAYDIALMSRELIDVYKRQRIRSAILLQLEPRVYRTRAGNLLAGKVWRNVYLHDERIFEKTSDSQLDTLTVDILLDGSASQREQQAKVATQGFIIAESLTRCNIPVRVSAFSSVSGCTVMQVLRDYHDTSRNKDILHFLAAGWNRDGLACLLYTSTPMVFEKGERHGI